MIKLELTDGEARALFRVLADYRVSVFSSCWDSMNRDVRLIYSKLQDAVILKNGA